MISDKEEVTNNSPHGLVEKAEKEQTSPQTAPSPSVKADPPLETKEPAVAATTSTLPSVSTNEDRMLRSRGTSGMEASVLRVKNVNFTVKKKQNQTKLLLSDINVKVKWGHVLASE